MAIYNSPRRDRRDLQVFGPRIEVEIGLPLISDPSGPPPKFSKMPALIDTGARLTLLTPQAVERVGLRKVNEMQLARAGGITENVGVYVASIQFPRSELAAIEIIEVACCELPEQPMQCLIGRDILSRWLFNYAGPAGHWTINDQDGKNT